MSGSLLGDTLGLCDELFAFPGSLALCLGRRCILGRRQRLDGALWQIPLSSGLWPLRGRLTRLGTPLLLRPSLERFLRRFHFFIPFAFGLE